MTNGDDYCYTELANAIANAKQAAHEVKIKCAQAMDAVIGNLTHKIKDVQASALPAKGWFARLGARFHKHRTVKKLNGEISFFEKAKTRIEGASIDCYRDAEKVIERAIEDIDRHCKSEDFAPEMFAAKRHFREQLVQCCGVIDLELDKLRDDVAEKSKKSEIKGLMANAVFSDYQRVTQLESLVNKGRLVIEPPVMESIPDVEEPKEEVAATPEPDPQPVPSYTTPEYNSEEEPVPVEEAVEPEPEPAMESYMPAEEIPEENPISTELPEEAKWQPAEVHEEKDVWSPEPQAQAFKAEEQLEVAHEEVPQEEVSEVDAISEESYTPPADLIEEAMTEAETTFPPEETPAEIAQDDIFVAHEDEDELPVSEDEEETPPNPDVRQTG